MKIYIMRHGTTVWNEKGIIQGRSKNRLSKSGINLVENTAKNCANINFDVIFSSPLTRTMQTANIMNKYHNVKVLKDYRLIEIDKGIFTGRLKKTLTIKEKEQKDISHKSTKMESREDVYKRTKKFIDYIRTLPCKSVLIVTHNIVASLLSNILLNKEINLFNKKDTEQFDNAEIKCCQL